MTNPECQNREATEPQNTEGIQIPFVNPLYGDDPIFGSNTNKKLIKVQVDNEDPYVTCGFHDIHRNNVVQNKTLFAYPSKKAKHLFEDAYFFFNITVGHLRYNFLFYCFEGLV